MSPKNRVTGRYSHYKFDQPINEIKGGLASNYYTLEPIAGWGTTGNRRPPGTAPILVGVFSGREIQGGQPGITFSGYTIGPPTNTPQRTRQQHYPLRDAL